MSDGTISINFSTDPLAHYDNHKGNVSYMEYRIAQKNQEQRSLDQKLGLSITLMTSMVF